ncbi:hypothetical protein N7466_010403 [Penicillium verhagenii]|uniref:uncharacterized protein n=1 Tax=Penicillium verhagenii TaxID=1562060 RepID=UPI00254501F4|nr:uncharacterized protein N7466_010403 [Penicillium verhagenii]KAJ5918411.1 hypothetical protein N7466_010403 [Penicillium verhagenii]
MQSIQKQYLRTILRRSYPKSWLTPRIIRDRYYSTTSSSSRLQHSSKPLQPRPQHLIFSSPLTTQTARMSSATSFFEFEPVDKKGAPFPLSSLDGKVVLVFEGLEKLYQTLKAKYPEDFTILGFPCNQFGGQDPGSNDDIQSFCQLNYGVTFPVLGKIDVNGNEAAPIFSWLKEQQPGVMGLKRIKWNFEKFLVGADGKVVSRYSSLTKPEGLQETIEKEIEKAKKAGTLASSKQ